MGRVCRVVGDAKWVVLLASTIAANERGREIDADHVPTEASQPARVVPVAAGYIEDTHSADLADEPKEGGIKKGPVPEIPFIALLLVVPLGQVCPLHGSHLALLAADSSTPRSTPSWIVQTWDSEAWVPGQLPRYSFSLPERT